MILRRMMRHVLPEGMSLRLRREWLARRIAAGTAHFEDDVPLLKRYVKPTDVCWDIGANTGTYTLHLSRLARQVFAFEPVPHNLDILRDVRKRAGLENVIISSLALSDRVGPAAMTVPVEGFYGGFYLARLDAGGSVNVQTTTVDALIAAGTPEPDFIKCDVEGAELSVLSGARQLLVRRRPIWLLESFEDRVIDFMRSSGYSAFTRNTEGRLVEVRSRVHERNYWFLPTT